MMRFLPTRFLPITDADDPRIAPYRAVRDRDLTDLSGDGGRPGRFMAEGEVVLRALLGPNSRFRAESVLVAAGREGSLPPGTTPDLPVYVAAGAVMNRIVGFPIHRGLLAAGLRRAEPALADILPPAPARSTTVVLAGIANHDNVGAVFRNAAAFGAAAVLLDGASCDPLYRKAIRVSVGASLLVPFRHGGQARDILDDLEDHGFVPVALSPGGGVPLAHMIWPDRTALVVGAEGPGLPAALLDSVHTVRIPMAPGFDSLNLATATGIALHANLQASLQASLLANPLANLLSGPGD